MKPLLVSYKNCKYPHLQRETTISLLANTICLNLYHTGQTPIDDDVIAPGMQRSYIITFTPDSLVNYRESMKVGSMYRNFVYY